MADAQDVKLDASQDASVWWTKIRNKNEVAKKNGALQSIETISKLVDDHGVKWAILFAPSLALKPSAPPSDKPKKVFNPFLSPDPELLIEPAFLPGYNLIFNKFNVVKYHLLITTIEFIPQTQPLNERDFEAGWLVMKKMDMLFFFNCGKNSGASQPHKHMQLLPLPIENTADGLNFGIESAIEQHRSETGIFTISVFPFVHAAINLSPDEASSQRLSVGTYLRQKYATLMQDLNLDLSEEPPENQAYNFIMTSKFMLIVPRKAEVCASHPSIAPNSVAFTGTLLVKSQEDLEYIAATGPVSLIKEVTFPIANM